MYGIDPRTQELAVSVRLQAIGGLFQRLERVAGDVFSIAKKEGLRSVRRFRNGA